MSHIGAIPLVKRESARMTSGLGLLELRAGALKVPVVKTPSKVADAAKNTQFDARAFMIASMFAALMASAGLLFTPKLPFLLNAINIPESTPRAATVWLGASVMGWAMGKYTASQSNAAAKEYCKLNVVPFSIILGHNLMKGSATSPFYVFFVPLTVGYAYFGYVEK